MPALPCSNKPGDMVYICILLNYKFKFIKILKVNKTTCLSVYRLYSGVLGGQNRPFNSLKFELQAVRWEF